MEIPLRVVNSTNWKSASNMEGNLNLYFLIVNPLGNKNSYWLNY